MRALAVVRGSACTWCWASARGRWHQRAKTQAVPAAVAGADGGRVRPMRGAKRAPVAVAAGDSAAAIDICKLN
jgi:hypothetical protein